MSSKNKQMCGWSRNFRPVENGFPCVLDNKLQHLMYLQENKLCNYLKKIEYHEYKGMSKAQSLARDFGYKSPSNFWYKCNTNPEDFIAAVRGFAYFRAVKGKSVHVATATAKGLELD